MSAVVSPAPRPVPGPPSDPPAHLLPPAGGSPVAPQARLLVGLAHDLAAASARWEPLLRFDPDRRFSTRLPGPEGVEVWLATWLPGQSSDLHDHGRTAAALTVVRGALVERRSGAAGAAHTGETALELGPGAVAVLEPGVLHSVANTGAVPAVSIHVRTTARAALH